MAKLPVHFHTKIRGEANPHDKTDHSYFATRKTTQRQWAIKDRIFLSSDAYARLTQCN